MKKRLRKKIDKKYSMVWRHIFTRASAEHMAEAILTTKKNRAVGPTITFRGFPIYETEYVPQ